MQSDWRWCNKCQGLAFSLNQPSICPASGSHDHTGSGNYALAVDEPSAAGQSGWRWCSKCQGLAFAEGLTAPSRCPAGGSHDHSQSGNYTLPHDDPNALGQSGWKWCRKCQGLAFSLNQHSVCSAGGAHDHRGSGNYTLAFLTASDVDDSETMEGEDSTDVDLIVLSGSVGKRGDNRSEDVTIVQTLLNAVSVDRGGPKSQLTVDGKCGDRTVKAIQGFQLHHLGWHLADGRLDQVGPTWDMLTNIILQVAPILLQVGRPRRALNIWLRSHSGKPGFDATMMDTIRQELFDLFSRVLARTRRFAASPSINWNPAANQVGRQDLLVYFVDKPSLAPKYRLLPDPTAPFNSGGATDFLTVTINQETGQTQRQLVMQVYCIEESQDTLRPGDYLARLAFHEMMHGRTDVGPSPKGTEPKTGKAITDLHKQGGAGLADRPTPPFASLTDMNRDVMAHNLHKGVRLYTGAL